MSETAFKNALIVGAGSGLSAALARALAREGIKVALAARSTDDLRTLAESIGATTHTCDATERNDIDRLFSELDRSSSAPDIAIYNASYRTRGPFVELDPAEVEKAIATTAYGAFLMAQHATRRMLPRRHGAILFTG